MRVIGLCAAALSAGLTAAQVPIDQEPRHHIEFVNDTLRVISPQIPPGDTTLEHIHMRDETTICIHGSSMRGKPHDGEWGKPGMPCVRGSAGLTEYTANPRSHTSTKRRLRTLPLVPGGERAGDRLAEQPTARFSRAKASA